MELQQYKYGERFALELGGSLDELEIGYHTYGTLNAAKDNVIWICHALTANSDPADWWGGFVGEGKVFDPTKYFIVCANILGSCYGTTGPLSTNPSTGKPYFQNFPSITIRDMVKAHKLLKRHLGIKGIKAAAGGSMGGYQALEWALMQQDMIEKVILLATSARESAWGIGIHTAQRMAIETDPTWTNSIPEAGLEGMKTARAIGLLTYRNYETFVRTQTDEKPKLKDFKATSYLEYQGEKLAKRFNAYSYWALSKAQDTHNIARNRSSLEHTLEWVKSAALVIGITSDILFPLPEQQFLAAHIPNSKLVTINSPYGHDGFLIEYEQIGKAIAEFL